MLCECPEGNKDNLPKLGLCVAKQNEQALTPTYDLDTFLEKVYPNITFLQYRRLEREISLDDDKAVVTLQKI